MIFNRLEKKIRERENFRKFIYFRAMENAPETTPSVNPLKRILSILRPVILDRLSIVDLADPKATIAGIQKDIEFKGFNVWILGFAIVIASIGLNVDSTAVVIGAMLISPLMGPIMGFGVGVGINDLSMVRKSILNLAVATGISIAASAVYFFISPLDTPSNELFARTNPTLLDVLVAIFGGLTGILAGSRKEKSNVIPGVAIATALMPPLCTAGFGLAHGDWHYFFGAFYLFLINAILIATSTTLVVRYLRFPMAAIPDEAKERKYKRYVAVALLALVLPSGWIFYRTVSEGIQTGNITTFLTEHVSYPGMEVVKQEITFEDGKAQVNLVLLGEFVPPALLSEWQSGIASAIPGTSLHVVQNKQGTDGLDEMQRLVDLYAAGRTELSNRDDEIRRLSEELSITREALERQMLPASLPKELLLQNGSIIEVRTGLVAEQSKDSGEPAYIPWVDITWAFDSEGDQAAESERIEDWLKVRLGREDVLLAVHERLESPTAP
jgi:uncharacterized hydrophobic protein (TIGR00271 family)